MSGTMKAMRYHQYGNPDQLRQDMVPIPEPSKGEIQIKLAATSVNPADWKIGAGYFKSFMDVTMPWTPGSDFAGVVSKLGDGVTDFVVGDRVYGAGQGGGGYAEMIVVPVGLAAKAPKSIPLTTAGAVPIAAGTAWAAVTLAEHGNVKSGQTVLIHGAAGGLGHFAVQFAVGKGAHVIATASSENAEFLRELGVERVIDYKTTKFETAVKDVDVVIDFISGDYVARSMPIIRNGGVYVGVLGPVDPELAKKHGVRVSNVSMYRSRQALEQIAQLIDDKKLRVVVSRELPLSDAVKGIALSQGGHTRGKIVLKT